ncbi:hypothetical protein WI75_08725 [Burkholderia ubonensis]|nr:hypothetical protein WI75_08725 [Burkholderia ubonensis]
MAAQLTGLLHNKEAARVWRVVAQYVERVFASMETSFACLHFAIHRVAFTSRILEPAAFQIFIKTLESHDRLLFVAHFS